MTPRPATSLLVNALVRRVAAAGGSAAVLARGDDQAGAILIVASERGVVNGLFERSLTTEGRYAWAPCGPSAENSESVDAYLERRRARDPDLWLIELDVAQAERFAAEIMGDD